MKVELALRFEQWPFASPPGVMTAAQAALLAAALTQRGKAESEFRMGVERMSDAEIARLANQHEARLRRQQGQGQQGQGT